MVKGSFNRISWKVSDVQIVRCTWVLSLSLSLCLSLCVSLSMDLVFNLHGSITYLDVSIVAPFSCNPSLVAAASTKPGLMAKRAEKAKFDRYPHINLVPFILETTSRPGSHAKKFINYLLRDVDNPPIAVRDTWSTHPSPNNNLWQPLRDYRVLLSHSVGSYMLFFCLRVPATRFCTQPFSVSSTLQWCHVASAVTSPLQTMTSTTLTAVSFSCLRTLALCPLCLTVLTDVDVLHIALGCRFALDLLTVSQHYSSALELEPLPDDPELFLF